MVLDKRPRPSHFSFISDFHAYPVTHSGVAGNRLNGSLKAFYWKNFRKFSLLPNAGVFTDFSDLNRDDDVYADETGGVIGLATLGLDVYAGHFSFEGTYQQPVFQDLGGARIQAEAC